MTCIYCAGKQTRRACKYCQPSTTETPPAKVANTAPGGPRSDDLPRTGIGVPADLSTSVARNLFELTDLHELLCVLCSKVIPNGRDQAFLRSHHGQQHVRRGEAVEDRRGLPAGAVRFFVKAPA
jgi:hypothetical protein